MEQWKKLIFLKWKERQKGGKIEIIILLFFESFGKYIIWILYLWEAFLCSLSVCVCMCVSSQCVCTSCLKTNNFNKRYLNLLKRALQYCLLNILPSFLHVIKQWSKKKSNTNPRKKKTQQSCRSRRRCCFPFFCTLINCLIRNSFEYSHKNLWTKKKVKKSFHHHLGVLSSLLSCGKERESIWIGRAFCLI